LDKMHEEMLKEEFSAEGAVPHGEVRPPVEHAVAMGAPVAAGGFGALATPEVVEEAPAAREGPRGLARYRNATMVGAGGVSCSVMGALIGGLGGPGGLGAQGGLAGLGADPAAAHSLACPASPGKSPATSHLGDDTAAAARGSAAVATASLSSLSGSLSQGIAPLNGLAAGTDAPPLAPGTGALMGQSSGGSSGLVSIPGSLAPSPGVIVGSPVPSVTAGIAPLAGNISGSLVPAVPSRSATSFAVSAVVPPTTDTPSNPTSGATSTAATTTTTTVTVPLSVPPVLVSTPPVSVGGVSVGVGTSGSGSGLTLTLP
jgi:hypothetical protein